MKVTGLVGLTILLTTMTGCPLLDYIFGGGDDEVTYFEVSDVVRWNEVVLAAVRNGGPRPTVVSRSLHILHASMYEAWCAYDDTANGWLLGGSLRRPSSEQTFENKRAAVNFAAYRAAMDQFPAWEAETSAFSRLLNDNGYDVSDSEDTSTPAGVGNVAAQTVLDFRQEDGANEEGNYAQITSDVFPDLYAPVNSADPESTSAPGGVDFDPNRWQPLRVPNGSLTDADGNAIADNDDPTTFTDQTFLTPHWGAVIPFALTSGDQFRPGPPPESGSDAEYTDQLGNTMSNDEAYNEQTDAVLALSGNLTDLRKVIAEYWADGPRSETPPGHWHALAHGISFRDRHSLDEDVLLYFALSGAIFDAGIATWEAKRVYDYVRPASAIQHRYFGEEIEAWGGPNQGTQTIMGEDWRPYQALTFVTPPFSEYTSGHSAFSAAAAVILRTFSGSDTFYDGETVLPEDFNQDGLMDLLGQYVVGVGNNLFEQTPTEVITLQWETFTEAANEAGVSRRYGGIHFQDGDLAARTLGDEVGEQAWDLAVALWTGEQPGLLED